MNSANTYKHFADADYKLFCEAREFGLVGNHLASMAQEICEKYLKHIADTYIQPETDEENSAKERALHTHNLRAVIKYIESVGIDVPATVEAACDAVNGFYFNTRYPGVDSFDVDERDMEKCRHSIDVLKVYTEAFIKAIEEKM